MASRVSDNAGMCSGMGRQLVDTYCLRGAVGDAKCLKYGGPSWTRTSDQGIMSPLL